MIVRMWEARANPEAFADLLSWVCDKAVPELEVQPLHVSSEVYSSADNRVVIVSKWRSAPMMPAEPPGHYLAWPARCRDYAPVDR